METSAQSMPQFKAEPSSHLPIVYDHSQYTRFQQIATPPPTYQNTHHIRDLQPKRETGTHFQFHATLQGCMLPHTDAQCSHNNNPLGVNAGNARATTSEIHSVRRQQSSRARQTSSSHEIPQMENFLPYDDDAGKHRLILYSAAQPTHHNRPLPSAPRMYNSTYTRTADNNQSLITHARPISINKNTQRIITSAVIALQIHDTLYRKETPLDPDEA